MYAGGKSEKNALYASQIFKEVSNRHVPRDLCIEIYFFFHHTLRPTIFHLLKYFIYHPLYYNIKDFKKKNNIYSLNTLNDERK